MSNITLLICRTRSITGFLGVTRSNLLSSTSRHFGNPPQACLSHHVLPRLGLPTYRSFPSTATTGGLRVRKPILSSQPHCTRRLLCADCGPFSRLNLKHSQKQCITFFVRTCSTMSTGSTGSTESAAAEGRCLSMSVSPQSCLVDDNLDVILEGLEPLAKYTVAATLTESGIHAASFAHFVADSSGCISLSKFPSQSGSYTGIDSTGLLWSMDIVPGQKPGRRIMKKDVTTPYEVEFSVYPGFMDPIIPISSDNVLDVEQSETHIAEPIIKGVQHRFYMATDVKRIEIEDRNVRGTFFIPPGDGPFPATIDMFGTAGGLLEFRAAILASRGIAALALPFFAFKDLPADLMSGIHMDYFEEAIDWLHGQPMVKKHGVGVIGVSAGAYLAILCAELFSKVKAVISINGSLINFVAPNYYKGKLVKEVMIPDWSECEFIEDKDDAISFHSMYDSKDITKYPKALLKPELSDAKFLMVVSGGDINTHPMVSMMVVDRLQEFGKEDHCELLYLDKAGHLVEPPHTMHCFHSYHKAYSSCFAWGGEKEAHAKAQVTTWAKMQEFLKTELSEPFKSKL